METRQVYGFLDSGKTTYIQNAVQDDIFYKYGSTLILCFEQGEAEYDKKLLSDKNARVVYYDKGQEVGDFCIQMLNRYKPDRVYLEMNPMMEGLREALPEELKASFAITLFDASTLELYLTNLRSFVGEMVRQSSTVTFNRAPSKEALSPYGQIFRMMNPRALYLRQDPMGYHEKAFDAFLPYDLEEQRILIGEQEFIPFCLDSTEHPEHYEGKELVFTLPLEVQKREEELLCGRTVMTCCMADLQFLSRPLKLQKGQEPPRGFLYLRARGRVAMERFGVGRLTLLPLEISPCKAPKELILGVG